MSVERTSLDPRAGPPVSVEYSGSEGLAVDRGGRPLWLQPCRYLRRRLIEVRAAPSGHSVFITVSGRTL
jgi:hypothetical protein